MVKSEEPTMEGPAVVVAAVRTSSGEEDMAGGRKVEVEEPKWNVAPGRGEMGV